VGELGAALARLLRSDGFEVVTTLENRSPRTKALAAAAGVRDVGGMVDVVHTSDVVISLVPPDAAVEVARSAAACDRPSSEAVYVDANSISPLTIETIRDVVVSHGFGFCDASIQGLAPLLAKEGVMYLSGEKAEEIHELFCNVLSVQNLGSTPGQASALKMLLGGLNKQLIASFAELAALAHRRDLVEEFLGACDSYYPGVLEVVARTLPTYPTRVRRRALEMGELSLTLQSAGITPDVAPAARRVLDRMAGFTLGEADVTDLKAMVHLLGAELVGSGRGSDQIEIVEQRGA